VLPWGHKNYASEKSAAEFFARYTYDRGLFCRFSSKDYGRNFHYLILNNSCPAILYREKDKTMILASVSKYWVQ
jgi:hypothetical protein